MVGSLIGRTAGWTGVTILTAALAFATAQQQPADRGKQIFERACSGCHSLEIVTQLHLSSRNEYGDIVTNMIASGATVSKQDEPILVDYLWDTLGIKPVAPAPADAAAAGRAILEQACTSCHGLDGMKNHVYSKADDYKSLVDSMISNGASVPPDQIPVLVDYLFKTYGKK